MAEPNAPLNGKVGSPEIYRYFSSEVDQSLFGFWGHSVHLAIFRMLGFQSATPIVFRLHMAIRRNKGY